MNGVIRKHNATFLGLFQNAHPKQNMNIAVDGANIAFRPACNLSHCARRRISFQSREVIIIAANLLQKFLHSSVEHAHVARHCLSASALYFDEKFR